MVLESLRTSRNIAIHKPRELYYRDPSRRRSPAALLQKRLADRNIPQLRAVDQLVGEFRGRVVAKHFAHEGVVRP